MLKSVDLWIPQDGNGPEDSLKNPKKFIRMAKIFASQTKINSNKYKYGAKVPTEHFQDLD